MPFLFEIGDIVTHAGMDQSRAVVTVTRDGGGATISQTRTAITPQRLFIVSRRAQPTGEGETTNIYKLRPILETGTQQYIQGVGSDVAYLEAFEHELVIYPT